MPNENVKIQIEYRPIADLIPYARNSKLHPDEQIAKISGWIREVGFINPVVIDKDGSIVAGHGRVLAARKLGMDLIPTIQAKHLTPEQVKSHRLADNKFADSGYDEEMLKLEFQELDALHVDIEKLGYSEDEIKRLLGGGAGNEGNGDPDDVPAPPVDVWVKKGDLFALGDHRLLCGDSTDSGDVGRLMNGEKADMVFTDPPYGIKEETDRVEHEKTFKNQGVAYKGSYSKIAGDDSTDVAQDVIAIATDLAPVVVYWGGNYYNLLPSSCWLVWDKRVEENQRDLNSDAELAWIKHPHKMSVRIFRHLWKGMIKASEQGERRCHPTQKPIALAEWCFGEYDPKGKTVLDLFLGSGSTLIACEKTGRRCFGMEIDPQYCQVILERWSKFSGKQWAKIDD